MPVYRRNLFTLGFSRIIKRGLEADLENKIYKVCPEGIQPLKTGIEEDTRDKKHCTQDNDTSVPFKVGTLGPHTVLPIAISCPIVFS